MRMQIFRVMKPLCTILKTKNCVPFEVQYYTCIERRVENSYVDTPDARKPLDFIFLRISSEFSTDQNRFLPFLSKTVSHIL